MILAAKGAVWGGSLVHRSFLRQNNIAPSSKPCSCPQPSSCPLSSKPRAGTRLGWDTRSDLSAETCGCAGRALPAPRVLSALYLRCSGKTVTGSHKEAARAPAFPAAGREARRSEQDGCFLKEILKPSEQENFDQLTRMEMSSNSNSGAEHAQPSANVGLPGHLIQCHRPRPAYATHTAPVVKMLVEQDDWRRAAAACPAWREPSPEPPGAAAVEEAPAPSVLSRGGSCAGMGKGSLRKSTAESSLLSPSARSRVIFARKPPSCVVLCGSLASSSKKK
nr:uncharacterized protein LOC113845535 isoform X1 [Anas platyrhynchos]